MQLFKDVLIRALEEKEINFVGFDKIIENRCYLALEEIINIVRTAEYDDAECFKRIEKIIETLENLGSDGGFRHDFI